MGRSTTKKTAANKPSQLEGTKESSSNNNNNNNNASTSGAPATSSSTVVPFVIPGADTEGKEYDSTSAMWSSELQGDLYDAQTGWYGKALHYWEKMPASIYGVLGGLDELHKVDVPETKAFLQLHLGEGHQRTRALDCAAGIGRVTKYVLAPMYETVDLLEPLPHMLDQAKKELEGYSIGEYILGSMETAVLPPNRYDLIMIQWAVIYLTDEDFVRFFRNCKAALRSNGYVVLKENCSSSDAFLVDKDDSSLTRSDKHYKALFAAAGLTVKAEAFQKNWPKDVIPVKMYALQ